MFKLNKQPYIWFTNNDSDQLGTLTKLEFPIEISTVKNIIYIEILYIYTYLCI